MDDLWGGTRGAGQFLASAPVHRIVELHQPDFLEKVEVVRVRVPFSHHRSAVELQNIEEPQGTGSPVGGIATSAPR